jgi:hypothetical protein
VSFAQIWQHNYTSNIVGQYNASIWANDTLGNEGNSSTLLYWNVTGYSDVTWLAPIGGSYPAYTNLDLICQVTDANSSAEIENYNVTFWANEEVISTDLTNSTGHATYTWSTIGPETTDLNCTIENNATLFYSAAQNMDSTQITILVPNVTVIDSTHTNLDANALNEYETTDTINWVNVTVNNTGDATATNTNISLNLLYPNGTIASWFDETKESCGSISTSSTCEVEFNNNSNGFYLQPGTSGIYNFNFTTEWNGGGPSPSQNLTNILIHNVPDNFTGYFPIEEVPPGDDTEYRLNFTNPWSKPINYINTTIACPENITCYCTGQEGLTCELNETGNNEFSANSSLSCLKFLNPLSEAEDRLPHLGRLLQ